MKKNFIEQLTFTRFIAAFMIVFFHYGGELFYIEGAVFEVIRPHFDLGVSYFYVLSGFVMMLAYGKLSKVNYYDFYLNRIARIIPLHFMGLLLLIWVTLGIGLNLRISFFSFLSHITLTQAWIPRYVLMYNVPAWSISVEVFFYLSFPFLYNCFIRKINFKIILIFVVLFWLLTQTSLNTYFLSKYYGGYDKVFMKYNPFLHFSSFLVGIMFGDYFGRNKAIIAKKHTDIILILLVSLSFMIIYLLPNLFYHNGLLSPFFGLIILYVAKGEGRLNKLFSKPFLFYLGEISFAIYLLQAPIYRLMDHFYQLFKIKTPYIEFLLSFLVLLLISHLTFRYIESPARLKIRKIFKKKHLESD